MPIVLLVNLKGGVAKTTNAVAIAECLASEGHRTLLIDADHQRLKKSHPAAARHPIPITP